MNTVISLRRGEAAALAVIAVISAVLFFVIAQTIVDGWLRAPAITWVVDEAANVGEVCPGEQVSYKVYLLLNVDNGGALWVSSTFRRADNHPDIEALRQDPEVQAVLQSTGAQLIGDTVVARGLGDVPLLNVPPGTGKRMLIDLDATFTVPALAPGPYERILAAGLIYTPVEQAMRIQKFTVPANCD